MPITNSPTAEPLTEVHQPAMLKPLIDPIISRLINNFPDKLVALIKQHGSPLNLVWPHALESNTHALLAVLKQYSVPHAIFYGAKANKSQSLLVAAANSGVGVDVSSVHELQAALRAGTPGARICATGPAKTAVFHQALVSSGSLISIDSLEEFEHLQYVIEAQPTPTKARVLLRYRPKTSPQSRFGMSSQDLLEGLQRLTKHTDIFHFEGFHFHLGGYGVESRAQALREISGFVEAAREMGLNPQMIDIGGGLPIRYVEPQIYARFLQNDNKPSHYYNQKVPEAYYPYGSDLTAPQWLALLLEAEHSPGVSIATYLKLQNITLALEPGRSLVDQAAISLFRVTRTKQLAFNKTVIFVEGSSFSACETWFASEYLLDPILISSQQPPYAPIQAYIAGHSCLDDDVITYRLINFSTAPRPGDILIYVNTAGYQMDLLENEFHRHPLPRRLTASCCTQGHYAFSPDY
ncbi:Y4yA family PLP-dependent enzyme [Pseudomonas sp. SWRI18]|uniref:Y4yA family PLP-dependent enzyme n=1 Tax=Pseudomonas sp. SWRI18 TaxID=2753888 RepID=UPI001646F766|nr:Y4yA family PLP-dependent enzyme [Pseudomonas sp. SWRI18]MBC3302963.1 Y4yA family PLP-dependent enzyme [Pseudomonas sp. SWRI18]